MAHDDVPDRTAADVGDLVLVARIVKPHGIRGEVVVDALSDVPGRFDVGARFRDRAGRDLTVIGSRPHQGRLLLRLDGIEDRNAAELLRGVELLGEPVDLSDTETYYAHELAGMEVRGEDGVSLGSVRDVIDLPAAAGYDLLEVERPDGTTWLLPAVDEYVEVVVDDDGTEALRLTGAPAGLVDPAGDDAATAGDAPEGPR